MAVMGQLNGQVWGVALFYCRKLSMVGQCTKKRVECAPGGRSISRSMNFALHWPRIIRGKSPDNREVLGLGFPRADGNRFNAKFYFPVVSTFTYICGPQGLLVMKCNRQISRRVARVRERNGGVAQIVSTDRYPVNLDVSFFVATKISTRHNELQ